MRRQVSPALILVALATILVPAVLLLTTRPADDGDRRPHARQTGAARVQRMAIMAMAQAVRRNLGRGGGAAVDISPGGGLSGSDEPGELTYASSRCCGAYCRIGLTSEGKAVAVCEQCGQPSRPEGLRTLRRDVAQEP